MMKGVDYSRWVKYLIQLMQLGGVDTRRLNIKGKKLCELGTGTGNIAYRLARYGFEVTGVDSSGRMLEIARVKTSKSKSLKPEFINHDMVTYQAKDQYDVMVCVYDSINYVSGRDNLELLFKNVFSNLKGDGIFVFDASLEPNSSADPELFFQHGRVRKIVYQRQSMYDHGTKTHTTRVRISRDGKVYEEVHRESVYDLETLREVAERAHFKEKFAAGDFTLLQADDRSERVHFILTK
jgi:2-polyprenyl-3-methyl-5-hydroxy-6-metoxy-1,4-benzoquinol methylase